jgi:disulfide bond formation protein DsbB
MTQAHSFRALTARAAGASPVTAAGAAFALAAGAIVGAWLFEWAGYAPCELCLQQRYAYYVGVPLAAVALGALAMGWRRLGLAALALLIPVFLFNAGFGAWHAGVEWGFWPGPAGCSNAAAPRAADMADFMRQMEGTRLVRCDEVAIRILGLSLAGWNALASLCVCVAASIGLKNARA